MDYRYLWISVCRPLGLQVSFNISSWFFLGRKEKIFPKLPAFFPRKIINNLILVTFLVSHWYYHIVLYIKKEYGEILSLQLMCFYPQFWERIGPDLQLQLLFELIPLGNTVDNSCIDSEENLTRRRFKKTLAESFLFQPFLENLLSEEPREK